MRLTTWRPEHASVVRRLLTEYWRLGDFRWQGEFEESRRLGGLPLYATMGASFFLTVDGELLRVDGEDSTVTLEEEQSERMMALISGSRRFQELAVLAPPPVAESTVCAGCRGGGWALFDDIHIQGIFCGRCFGFGWVPVPIV